MAFRLDGSRVISHRVVIHDIDMCVRHLDRGDHQQLYALTVEDDWALCDLELDAALHAYPDCVVGAFTEDGTLICACAAVAATPEAAFIGLFITTESHRGKGIGSYIFTVVMALMGDRNVILDSLVDAARFYTKRGFRETGMYQYQFSWTPRDEVHPDGLSKSIVVEQVSSGNMSEALAYESTVCPINRSGFIKEWMAAGRAFLVRKAGAVCGVSLVWRYKNAPPKYRLAGFYADDTEAACALLAEMIARVVGRNSLLMYFPHENLARVSALAERFGADSNAEKRIDNKRVATKGDLPGLALHKVYSVTYSVCDFI